VTTAGALVRACHPEPALAVTLIAGALAVGTDAPVLQVMAAFAAGQDRRLVVVAAVVRVEVTRVVAE
jgi:hypothetical protein